MFSAIEKYQPIPEGCYALINDEIIRSDEDAGFIFLNIAECVALIIGGQHKDSKRGHVIVAIHIDFQTCQQSVIDTLKAIFGANYVDCLVFGANISTSSSVPAEFGLALSSQQAAAINRSKADKVLSILNIRQSKNLFNRLQPASYAVSFKEGDVLNIELQRVTLAFETNPLACFFTVYSHYCRTIERLSGTNPLILVDFGSVSLSPENLNGIRVNYDHIMQGHRNPGEIWLREFMRIFYFSIYSDIQRAVVVDSRNIIAKDVQDAIDLIILAIWNSTKGINLIISKNDWEQYKAPFLEGITGLIQENIYQKSWYQLILPKNWGGFWQTVYGICCESLVNEAVQQYLLDVHQVSESCQI